MDGVRSAFASVTDVICITCPCACAYPTKDALWASGQGFMMARYHWYLPSYLFEPHAAVCRRLRHLGVVPGRPGARGGVGVLKSH